ncbi:hypothetical protein QVD17_33713 [Tagetes erecta]|uniref:Uncharacterized protein n=1 Tax=Tagetes erecta TaxID=13708 RepID=A0AAD8JX15_TARER|nr:hypothetical protein QVD17_33713 [Tagetes erecta]
MLPSYLTLYFHYVKMFTKSLHDYHIIILTMFNLDLKDHYNQVDRCGRCNYNDIYFKNITCTNLASVYTISYKLSFFILLPSLSFFFCFLCSVESHYCTSASTHRQSPAASSSSSRVSSSSSSLLTLFKHTFNSNPTVAHQTWIIVIPSLSPSQSPCAAGLAASLISDL